MLKEVRSLGDLEFLDEFQRQYNQYVQNTEYVENDSEEEEEEMDNIDSEQDSDEDNIDQEFDDNFSIDLEGDGIL